jgi:hypothetical protein
VPDLFNKPLESFTTDDTKTVVDIYKTLIDMADKVSQRRQAANNFYLSVNTAIIGASSYLWTIGRATWTVGVIAFAGIGICLVWQRNIESYRTLNSAKFKVINELESALPVSPFMTEWSHLDPHDSGTRHLPFHAVEILIPRIFIGLHLVQGLRSVPWAAAVEFVTKLARCLYGN